MQFLKIFLYPELSTNYYSGLLGWTEFTKLLRFGSPNYDKSLKVHILQEPATGNYEFIKKQCFSSLKLCSILNNTWLHVNPFGNLLSNVILRVRSLKCFYIFKSTFIQACHIGNSLNSPTNFDSISENSSISRTVHLVLLRPTRNYQYSPIYWDSNHGILINL